MDIAFTNISVANTYDLWSAVYDRDQLFALFQQAITHACEQRHPILTSITLPVSSCDPVHIFALFEQLALGDRFFWMRPADQRALVGVGQALTIETTGTNRVNQAAATWRDIRHHAVSVSLPGQVPAYTTGPLLFGGFAFDTLNPRTADWQDFPDGLLILPTLLFHSDEECAALTLNAYVEAEQDAEELTARYVGYVEKLQSLVRTQSQSAETVAGQQNIQVNDIMPAQQWQGIVQTIVDTIRNGSSFDKAVLARSVHVSSENGESFVIPEVLLRLRQSYPAAYVFAIQRQQRYFVGATPERLVCSEDGQIQTMALAGSAPRGATEEEDQRLGAELLHSLKNQGEHHYVVDTIRQALTTLCSRVWVDETPHLLKLKNIQHLETPLMGDLRPGHSILEAIEYLHPTPAVGGYPRQPALTAIREHEHLDRGWYASPIGWIGASGNGEFAVALRSGLVEGNEATLFAGCGIVANSDPESEYQESCWKLQVMLRGLGGE